MDVTRQERRDKIGLFHPAGRCGRGFPVDPGAAADLGPEPLGGIDIAVGVEIGQTEIADRVRELLGLPMGGVILPQPGIDVLVFGKAAVEGQAGAAGVDGDGGAGRRIDPDADDPLRIDAGASPRLLDQRRYEALERLDIVPRVLAGQISVGRIGKDPLHAARIGMDGAGDLPAGCYFDEEGPGRVRAEVKADGIGLHG